MMVLKNSYKDVIWYLEEFIKYQILMRSLVLYIVNDNVYLLILVNQDFIKIVEFVNLLYEYVQYEFGYCNKNLN